jgi:hypothetical protein
VDRSAGGSARATGDDVNVSAKIKDSSQTTDHGTKRRDERLIAASLDAA